MDLPICSECERPGELLHCIGGCNRYFHKECVHQGVLNTYRWICPDCQKHVHRCAYCRKYGADNQLVQCSYHNCCKYFHLSCLKEHRIEYTHDQPFICPCHYCALCKELENNYNPLLKCTRCCKSYHRSCLPSSVSLLDSSHFVCVRHRLDNEVMPPLTMDILQQRNNDENITKEDTSIMDIQDINDYDQFCDDYYKSQSINQHTEPPSSKRYKPT